MKTNTPFQVVMDPNSLYDQYTCRASVVQLIAEKSVNCSLMSLPRVSRTGPTCGPLEGLALMYVLREQGYLVTVNSTLLRKFESTLSQVFWPFLTSLKMNTSSVSPELLHGIARGLACVAFLRNITLLAINKANFGSKFPLEQPAS